MGDAARTLEVVVHDYPVCQAARLTHGSAFVWGTMCRPASDAHACHDDGCKGEYVDVVLVEASVAKVVRRGAERRRG